MKRLPILLFALVLGGAAILAALAATTGLLSAIAPAPELNASELPEPKPAFDFTLTAADGRRVSPSDFEEQVVLIFFGYTRCPDICPTTMADLGHAVEALGEAGEEVQVLMVTVDPARDDAEMVDAYVRHFHPSFIGLSGTEEEIAAAAGHWGVYSQSENDDGHDAYTVAHTGRVFVVDREGLYRASFPFGTTRAALVADLRVLLEE